MLTAASMSQFPSNEVGPRAALCSTWRPQRLQRLANRFSEPSILAGLLPLTHNVGISAQFLTNENFVAKKV